MKYDYLIVGAGLFGAVFAHEATKRGKRCLVVEKRGHIAGNVYTEEVEGIQVHKYFPYEQRRSLAVRPPICQLQSLHQLTRCQLQGQALQPSLQYEHLLSNVGSENTH